MQRREHAMAVQRGTVYGRAERFGEGNDLGDRVRGGDLVADHDPNLADRWLSEQVGERIQRIRYRPPVDGRWRRYRVVVAVVEQVHRDRDEHRPARRTHRIMEGAAQDRSELICSSDFVRPLRDRSGEPGEVAGEKWVGRDVAIILLPGRHDERRLIRLSVGQRADRVTKTGRSMQIQKSGTTRRLRIPLGDTDRGRLLEREHVVQVVGASERVDQR